MTDFIKLNDYVRRKSDKFSGETITETNSNGSIRLCHLSSEKGDKIFYYLEYSRNHSWDPRFERDNVEQPRLDLGELFILLNGNKRYSLRAQVVQPSSCRKETSDLGYAGSLNTTYLTEYIAYELSKDILLEIANANTIELKVTGGTVSEILQEKKYQISFILMAKALCNAVFDNSLFLEDFQKEERYKAEKAELVRRFDENARKSEAEEEQRRKALVVFLYILLAVTIFTWIYVSFHYFNWLDVEGDTLGEIIEGGLNMLWTGLFVLPIGIPTLGKLADMGWH